MDPSTFFHLGSGTSTSRLAEWAPGEVDVETVTCPANEGHQHPGKRLTDLSVILPGNTVEDIVWTWYSECLLTDRALELFKAAGFTGFQVRRVKARYKRADAEPPCLWELVMTGWAGVASPESGIRLTECCPACGYMAYSAWTHPNKLIVPSQWDGSDFFMIWPLPGKIFLTKRAAHAMRESDLSGGVLKRPEELTWSSIVIPRISPGRLSYHMPEKRARELGEPLGLY